jgi:hypothetical protein
MKRCVNGVLRSVELFVKTTEGRAGEDQRGRSPSLEIKDRTRISILASQIMGRVVQTCLLSN